MGGRLESWVGCFGLQSSEQVRAAPRTMIFKINDVLKWKFGERYGFFRAARGFEMGLRYHWVHEKVLVDICVILPFLLAGTSCAGWVHIPREHSTPPNCQRNETHIGNTCWGLVQSGETAVSFSFSSRIFLTGRNKSFQSLGLWAFWHMIFDTWKLLPSRDNSRTFRFLFKKKNVPVCKVIEWAAPPACFVLK